MQIFCQYREHAAFLWRGFTVQQMANQCFGNVGDPSKGRQMPIHYGSADLNLVTVSSVVATQAPHAVGAAYALKVRCWWPETIWHSVQITCMHGAPCWPILVLDPCLDASSVTRPQRRVRRFCAAEKGE